MKGYRDNDGGARRGTTVYDDVFGGPPKFGATTLPPRVEDYTEIFQGFHASRGSSIPVLDLPAPAGDGDDMWFDVRSSKLDYSEVFGGFNGLDFAVSYDELFNSSKTGDHDDDDDLSDEAWTPAQSESLSDETDPYVSLEMENKKTFAADPNHLFGMRPQNEPNLEAEKDVVNKMTNDSQLLHVLESSVLENQALSDKIENEKFFSVASNDLCASSKDIGGVAERKKLKKSLSQPLVGVHGTERYGNQKDIPLLSVTDLGLKTQPSHLPPPSRPPPVLKSKKADFSNFNSKLKTSKSYAFERMTGDHSPPYFDVEVDSSSSAAAAMQDAVAQAQAKLRSAKELKDRKKEGSRSKLRMENNIGDKKESVNEGYEVSNVFGGERMKGSLAGDSTTTRYDLKEENQKRKNISDVTGTVEREKNITEAGNSVDIKTKEQKLYLGVDKTEGTVASREATEPFETAVRKPVQYAGILEPNAKSTGFIKYNKPVFESFEPMEEGKIVEERIFSALDENNEKQETLDRRDREEETLNERSAAHKTSTPEESENICLDSQHRGDSRTLHYSENELFENLIEIQLKDNDMKPAEKIVIENWLKNDNGQKEVDMGPASYIWEDYDVGFEEASEKENAKGLKETEEQNEKEFQQSCCPEISILKTEVEDDHDRGEGGGLFKDPFRSEEDETGSANASEQEECVNILETVSEPNQKILPEELTQEENKIKVEDALEKEEKACARDDDARPLKHAEADEKIKTIHETDCNSEENKNLQREWEREENKEKKETVSKNADIENEGKGTKWDENESTTEENSEVVSDLLFQVDDNEILQATGDLEHGDKNEATTLDTSCSVKSHSDNEEAEETVEQMHKTGEESFSTFELDKNDLQGVKVKVRSEDVSYSNSLNESSGKTYGVDVIGQTPMENDKRRTTTSTTTSSRLAKESVESRTKPLTIQVESLRNTNRSMERKDEIRNKAVSENREKEERLQRVRELENERLRKIEEERERQIEREKDRMAVDRATLEASETRERSERAAVERATAEFRQRALADARERLEKACSEARERSLAEKAMEGRLRVEKATAEARERAVADKFSSYQNTGMRQNSLPSDQAGTYSGLRNFQTAAQNGGEGESPQRCKARLERHQRTADRAANALAEKNMRDLIAQKEQAERNRLAEGLDAEVKRWSSGKQGNLRALLSTLQYILGSDSGWQAVPLTEVITTPAVKKAYRKATLCVHPDKLQQRGATIQQKYICEKVFDLLKEAWTKFNSEER